MAERTPSKSISDLSDVSLVDGTETVPMNTVSGTKKSTISKIKDFIVSYIFSANNISNTSQTLTTSVVEGGAAPFEVSALTGSFVGSGALGIPGEYALVVAGGPVGHTAFITIGGSGSGYEGKIQSSRIGSRGISTSNSLPVYSLPAGTGLTGATLPTPVVTSLTNGRVFFAPNSDGTQKLGWQISSGVIAPYLVGGVQWAEYFTSGINNVTSTLVEIKTDAFSMSTVDQNGFLISLVGNDFIEQSINQSYLTDLISHSFITTDAFVYSIVDSDGYLFDFHNGTNFNSVTTALSNLSSSGESSTVTDPTSYIPVGEYLAAMIYGQSVFTGLGTIAISTSPFSGGGLKMFNGGTQLGNNYSNSSYTSSLVDCIQGVSNASEDAARGVGEGFFQFFTSEAGYNFTDDGVNLILSVPAEGGKSAYELSDGGSYFPRLKYAIDAIDAIAGTAGKVPDVIPLVYCQGEQDMNLFTSPTAWTNQIENGIRVPFEAYCQAKFGRKTKVKIIMTQEASHQYYGITDPAIARQVLNICNTNSNYVFAGAMYQYEYGLQATGGSVGSHLRDATEMKWAAAMAGRVLQRVTRGAVHKWINPLRAWQDGLRSVMIEYSVPVGPLVIDTTNVSDPGQKGFNLYSNGIEVAITNVSVVGLGKKIVRLTTGTNIPVGTVTVDYAHKGGATSQPAGRSTGSRGCLRDSDPAVFDPLGIAKHLYNWAPIHRITVG